MLAVTSDADTSSWSFLVKVGVFEFYILGFFWYSVIISPIKLSPSSPSLQPTWTGNGDENTAKIATTSAPDAAAPRPYFN